MNKLLVVVVACFAGALSITVQQAVTARCDTGSVRGLSQQLIEQINCLAPGLMTDMRGSSGIQFGANAFPYLQNNAADALKRAVASAGTTISVNSALRSLPQQYLLYKWHNTGRCNQKKPAAAPGGSNHNGGLAIDINNHQAWISKLKAVNFQWYGPSDKVHFTYKGSSQDIRGLSVKAFCQLWNYNNPNDPIPVVTAFGSTVERKLLLSPAEGFDRMDGCAAARFSDELMANATMVELMNKREDETTDYGPCVASNGISGKCIEASACAAQGGAGQPGNCPAPNGITCCLVGYVAPDIPDDDTVLVGSSANIQRTNEAGVHLIQSFEGYKANFYIDAVGIRTIGYGHACHVSDCKRLVGKKYDGSTYTVTAPLSLQEANDLLRADLENLGFEDCVNRYVTANINDNQFSALVAFTLNVGCGNFKKSTLLKRVNAGAAVEGTTGIRNAFLKFNKGNGKVLAGLTRRRNAEADLYAGRYSSRTVMLREHGVERGSPETDGSGSDCWHYGQKGVCLASAFCDGFRVEGLCPGTSSPDVKCCLRDTCDSTGSGTKDGICGLEAQCSGTVSSTAVCKGATDLKCCKGTFNEPTTTCPDDSTWSTTDRWCATNDGAYALGPFTRAMEDKCGATGQPDSVCKDRYQFTWNGDAINLKKWPIDVARRIRGTEACPLGSSPNTNYLGYCVEEINERVPNTTDEFVGVKYVYGAMNADIIEGCKQFSGGLACNTPRYDGDFFRSLTQTYFQAIVQDYENSTATREDDETDGIPSDVPSIRTGETMNKLSDEHAVNDDELNTAASAVACFAVVLLALLF